MANEANRKMKVLVLEDDDFSRRYFHKIVENAGYETKAVENGRLGYELYPEYEPDLIICDIQMPEMDGLEFLEKIRADNSKAIVIIATAFESEDYAIRALQLGANNYLKKPVYPENLLQLLKKYSNIIQEHTIFDNIVLKTQKIEFCKHFRSDMQSIHIIVDYLLQYVKEVLPDSERIGIELGLSELITNAVEHGNLGISYTEKSKALDDDRLPELVNERLQDETIAKRSVQVEFILNQDFMQWTIIDEGDGFDWENVQNPLTQTGIEKLHGRGIFISGFQFDEMEYMGKGNKVRIRKYITQPKNKS